MKNIPFVQVAFQRNFEVQVKMDKLSDFSFSRVRHQFEVLIVLTLQGPEVVIELFLKLTIDKKSFWFEDFGLRKINWIMHN